MLNAGFWLESDDNQDEEPEQQEEEDADPQEANDNLMRLLQQLRGVPNGEEGEERDDAGMDDVLNRLMAHLNPGRGAQEPPSPQMILNEQMYQAARSGDLQALQQAVSSGAFASRFPNKKFRNFTRKKKKKKKKNSSFSMDAAIQL